MTRLDDAQAQFIKWLQLRAAMGENTRIDGSTLGALIDCARAYIDDAKGEADESAAHLKEEADGR